MPTISQIIEAAKRALAQAAANGTVVVPDGVKAPEDFLGTRIMAGLAPGETVRNSLTMNRALYTQDAKDFHDLRMFQVTMAAVDGQARLGLLSDLALAGGAGTVFFPHWKTRRVSNGQPLVVPGGRSFRFVFPGNGKLPESLPLVERYADGTVGDACGVMTFQPLENGWFRTKVRKVFSDRFWSVALRFEFSTGEHFSAPVYLTKPGKQAISDDECRVVVHGIGIDVRHAHLNLDREHGFRMSYVDLVPEPSVPEPKPTPAPEPVEVQAPAPAREKKPKKVSKTVKVRKTAKKAPAPEPPIDPEDDDPSINPLGF